MAEDKNEHLASKFETVDKTTPNSTNSCNFCDLIFKSESELDKNTEQTNKQKRFSM